MDHSLSSAAEIAKHEKKKPTNQRRARSQKVKQTEAVLKKVLERYDWLEEQYREAQLEVEKASAEVAEAIRIHHGRRRAAGARGAGDP